LTKSTQLTILPPPLALLRDTPAGAIYSLTTKNELFLGLGACQEGIVVGAEWSDDRNVLTHASEGPQISFTADGPRLLTECTVGNGVLRDSAPM
jgi:non-specific serine/threonine protein kinase